MKSQVAVAGTSIPSKNGKADFKNGANEFYAYLTNALPSYAYTNDEDDEPIESQLKAKILFLNNEKSYVHKLLYSEEAQPYRNLISEWHPFFKSNLDFNTPIKRLPDEEIKNGNNHLNFKSDDSFFNDPKNKSIISAMAQSKALRRYEAELDKFIRRLEDDLNNLSGKKTKRQVPLSKDRTDNNYYFELENASIAQKIITDFKKGLESKNLIEKDTDLPNFRKIFRPATIAVKDNAVKHKTFPIAWIGNKSELYYLIQTLIKRRIIVSDERWVVVENCFVDKNGRRAFTQDIMQRTHLPSADAIKKLDNIIDAFPKNV